MFWHPPWYGDTHKPRQVCGFGFVDRRATTEHAEVGQRTGEQVCQFYGADRYLMLTRLGIGKLS